MRLNIFRWCPNYFLECQIAMRKNGLQFCKKNQIDRRAVKLKLISVCSLKVSALKIEALNPAWPFELLRPLAEKNMKKLRFRSRMRKIDSEFEFELLNE